MPTDLYLCDIINQLNHTVVELENLDTDIADRKLQSRLKKLDSLADTLESEVSELVVEVSDLEDEEEEG